MSATSLDLSQIRTDALSSDASFRTLIGVYSSAQVDGLAANYATAAQGMVADSALQPGDITSGVITAGTGDIDFDDLGGASNLFDTASGVRVESSGGELGILEATIDAIVADTTDVTIKHESATSRGGNRTPHFSVDLNSGTVRIIEKWGTGQIAFGHSSLESSVRWLYGTGVVVKDQNVNSLIVGMTGQWGRGTYVPNAHTNNFLGFSGSNAVQIRPVSAGVLAVTNWAIGNNPATLGELRVAGVQNSSGTLQVGLAALAPYTAATVPLASAHTGATIRITDREQKQAYSDGADWLFTHDNTVVS